MGNAFFRLLYICQIKFQLKERNNYLALTHLTWSFYEKIFSLFVLFFFYFDVRLSLCCAN